MNQSDSQSIAKGTKSNFLFGMFQKIVNEKAEHRILSLIAG